MKKILSFSWCLILMTCFSVLNVQAQKSIYRIDKIIHLNGDGSWDYLAVDEINQKLFVSHGTQVNVVDIKTSSQVAVIPETYGSTVLLSPMT